VALAGSGESSEAEFSPRHDHHADCAAAVKL